MTKEKTSKGSRGSKNKPGTSTKAKEVTKEVADATQSGAKSLKSGAEVFADDARLAAEDVADDVGAATDRVGTALRDVAGSLKDGSLQERTFGQLAQSLADVSDAIREQELGEMSRNVTDFARRNPLLFAGAAALLGIAVSRMVSNERSKT